jgi:hypothetical protein
MGFPDLLKRPYFSKSKAGHPKHKSVWRNILEVALGIVIGAALLFSIFYYPFFSVQWRMDEVCASIPSSGFTVEEIKRAAADNKLRFFIPNLPNGQKAMMYADIPTIRAIRFVKMESGLVTGCEKTK